jgi:hypothetical protein
MKKIFIRSPYYITVNETGQVGAKVELRFKKAGGSYPTNPNYSLIRKIPSSTQIRLDFDVSKYAKDFIQPIAPGSVATAPESTDIWCFMEVKRYNETAPGTYNLLNTEEFVCLYGYNGYMGGVNQHTTASVVPLFNPSILLQRSANVYVNCYFDAGSYDIDNDDTVIGFTLANPQIYKVALDSNLISINKDGVGTLFTLMPTLICEPKYTPKLVTFINRFGGWQPLTFFKASKEQFTTKAEKYKTFPPTINYNPLIGQSKKFNNNGTKSITLNTGWVPENYSQLIEDLLLSETVLIDNVPVLVKTESQQIKTRLIDKMINYEIEFEYNFNMINNA